LSLTQNMKRAPLSFLVFIIALLSFTASESPLERLITGFKKYLTDLPQEKIYLHFDRPYYTNGDTIWFKAYLTAGAFHKPSPFSRTIYVELINERRQLVQKLKLFADKGSAAGNIALADSLRSGNYLVRAYTRWMKNGEEDYFFHRMVKIWNKEIQSPAISSNEKSLDIRFFPEGGNFVSGLPCTVAFKAVGSDGLGKEVKGKIVNESNEVTAEFKSNHLGMGAFSFVPQKGKSYHAIIDNQNLEASLPTVKESGLVLSVKSSPNSDDLTLKILTTDYTGLKTINILAQTRGVVCYAARPRLAANFMMIKIPKSKFPAGVAQITVADSTGSPLAERLIFVDKNEEHLILKVTSDKATYARRELVSLHIQAIDNEGQPAVANMSIAVCDDSEVLPDENRETISSYLLLSSDLRGYIESPGYYFNPANGDRAEALDHLMLTQGWRRFTFRKALEQQWQKPEYQVEQGLTIRGKMRGQYNDKPVEDGKVSYIVTGPPPDIRVTHTNATGDFELNDIIYFGSASAVIQGATKKGIKWVKFHIDTLDFQATRFPLLPINGSQTDFEKAFIAKSIERKTIDKAFDTKAIMLKEVEVIAKKDKPITSNSIYGEGSFSETVSNNPALSNMQHPLQLLQGRVAGVQVSGGGQNWSVTILGSGSIMAGTSPLIMLDNMPVEMSTLSMIPVNDIESFMVWKGADAAIFGARGSNGAIGFFTKKGGGVGVLKEGLITFKQVGFQIEREFYKPKYDIEKPEHKKPDKRVTLFWAPRIQTDSTGHASVSFYNHDLETSVTGIVEGISTIGKPGSVTFKYTIKKN